MGSISPALLTRMSSRPKGDGRCDQALHVLGQGDVAGDRDRRAACGLDELAGQGFDPVGAAGAKDHGAAPRSAKWRAAASPMPRLAPVTRPSTCGRKS
jgi:hypothetical protein